MTLIKYSNIALAFLLELAAIIILSYWGFTLQAEKIIRITVGIAAPILLMLIWSIWCAPTSTHRLEGVSLVLMKLILFSFITFCLYSIDQQPAALFFGILVLANLAISGYFRTL